MIAQLLDDILLQSENTAHIPLKMRGIFGSAMEFWFFDPPMGLAERKPFLSCLFLG